MALRTSRTTRSRLRSDETDGKVWSMRASEPEGGAPARGAPLGSLRRHAGLLRRGQADVEVRDILHVRPRRGRLEVHDQAVLDREHRVVFEILVVAVEDLRDELLMAGRADAEVDVGRPIRVPIHHLKQVAGWAVEGDRVLRRPDAA